MIEIMKPFFLAVFVWTILASAIYYISGQEKKCIDGKVHKLVSNEYWQGTGFTCKPLSDKRINETVT